MTLEMRLLVSGSIMFMVGLVFALPPIHYNQALFPNTRSMFTLHVEATQNGIMLIALAYISTVIQLRSTPVRLLFEFASNLGAWMNVIPWLFAGITGCVVNFGPGTVAVTDLVPPANNAQLMGVVTLMLMLCGLGDLIAWTIVIINLLAKWATGVSGGNNNKSKKQ